MHLVGCMYYMPLGNFTDWACIATRQRTRHGEAATSAPLTDPAGPATLGELVTPRPADVAPARSVDTFFATLLSETRL